MRGTTFVAWVIDKTFTARRVMRRVDCVICGREIK